MVSILILWGLQAFAAPYGETHDWAAVLEHLILTLTFVAFFPGQSFWNFQVSDGRGGVISIIGRATHADQSYATRK